MLLPLMSSPPGKALHTSHSVIAAEVWKKRSMSVCARKSRAAETCTTVFSNGKQHADVPTAFKGVSKRLGYALGSSNMNTSHSCYNKSFILYSVLVNPSIHNGRYHIFWYFSFDRFHRNKHNSRKWKACTPLQCDLLYRFHKFMMRLKLNTRSL